jgi:hypothetical protein
VFDFEGDGRPRAGEVRRDCEKDWICSVKSRSRFVVSFSLYERRGVGEGVRSVRRTVEGVI